MGVTGILLSIAVNVILLAAAYLMLSRKIRRQGSTEYVLGNVRTEVDEMITELNQTADRNIGLIEARLSRMKEMIDKADSRLTLLQKETDKQTKGAATYSNVRPRIVQNPLSERKGASGETGQVSSAAAGAESDSGGNSRESERPAARGGKETAPAEEAPRQEPAAGKRGGAESAGAEPVPRKRESAAKPDKRAKVIELHRQGISPDIIASRLDSTIGEVELIITMAEGRGT